MITQHDLEKYDPSGMHKIYDKWPEIAKQAYDSNLESIDFPNIDNVVFAGMGGSGAIGDLFSSILSKSNIHVSLVKGYLLPKTVDKNTLVITAYRANKCLLATPGRRSIINKNFSRAGVGSFSTTLSATDKSASSCISVSMGSIGSSFV